MTYLAQFMLQFFVPDLSSLVSFILLATGIFLIVLEIGTGNSSLFDLLISGIALVTGGVIGMFTGNWLLAIIVAVICVAGYWLILRVWLHKWLKANTVHHVANAEKLLGTETKITRESKNGKNHFVKINGEEWLIEVATKAEVGQTVKIVNQQGTRLVAEIVT